MSATSPSKPLLWSGISVAGAGVVALLVVALADLGKADQIASVVGVILAAAGLGLTLWGQFGRGTTPAPAPAPLAPAPDVTASGAGSVAAGGNIGSVVTGGSGTSPAPAPAPAVPAPVRPAPGSVTASGDRSVAAGGDIGSVSTGDA
ncbi:hypothetical protein ACFW96_03260 [Streptomyces gardneri]|uniref:hypothetical protein n=1 Tax=Streptomyces gardneri TaxID=66892 RepID=UPI0036C65A22